MAEVDEAADMDMDRRDTQRQFYQKLELTQEYAENNYWHLSLQVGISSYTSTYTYISTC